MFTNCIINQCYDKTFSSDYSGCIYITELSCHVMSVWRVPYIVLVDERPVGLIIWSNLNEINRPRVTDVFRNVSYTNVSIRTFGYTCIDHSVKFRLKITACLAAWRLNDNEQSVKMTHTHTHTHTVSVITATSDSGRVAWPLWAAARRFNLSDHRTAT